MEQSRSRSGRARRAVVLGVVATVVVAALALFEPWRAFTSSTIDEAAPVAADVVQVSGDESRLAPQAPAPTGQEEPGTAGGSERESEPDRKADQEPDAETAPAAEPQPEPEQTVDPEPATQAAPTAPSPTPTSAAATEKQDVELARGRFEDAEHGTTGLARVLQLADGTRVLRLEGLATSDGPDLHVWISNQPSGGEWGSYDDDRYVRLGELKATNGNQNYAIPASADLRGMTSVVIWCDRFNVAFGTAPVEL